MKGVASTHADNVVDKSQMRNAPDISVVMGVFNDSQYLRETVDSILSQSDVDFELVVVNDGSTDSSGDILEEYARQDGRVKVISQRNRGLTRALMVGCSLAKGKYVARHDVGDTSEVDRLWLQKAALDGNPEVAFVSAWTEFCGPHWEALYTVTGDTKILTPAPLLTDDDPPRLLVGPSHHGSVMFRKDSYSQVGGYRAQFYFGQDWDLWYRLADVGTFQMLDKTLYRARVTAGGISLSNKMRQEEIASLSFQAMLMRRRGLPEGSALARAAAIKRQLGRSKDKGSFSYFVGECLRRNKDGRAKSYFRAAVRENPFLLKAWLRLLQSYKDGGFSHS